MGYRDEEMTVNVNRKTLLVALNNNKGKHESDYKSAKKGFIKLLEEELERKLESLRRGDEVKLDFENHKPESHVKEYEDIIGMLELSVDDNVELTYAQYKQFYNDEWDWKRHWSASNAAYISAAV